MIQKQVSVKWNMYVFIQKKKKQYNLINYHSILNAKNKLLYLDYFVKW